MTRKYLDIPANERQEMIDYCHTHGLTCAMHDGYFAVWSDTLMPDNYSSISELRELWKDMHR